MTPLIHEFSVAATREHAFDMWTNRPALWWPRRHTVTEAPDLDRDAGRLRKTNTNRAWSAIVPLFVTAGDGG